MLMNKATTMGAAALATCAALAGGSMLVAPAALAARAGAVKVEGPVRAAVGLPPAGDQFAYVQRGSKVVVFRQGLPLAAVTVKSAAHPGGKGKLVLSVKANHAFAFRAGQFVWADRSGDHQAFNPVRKIRVLAGHTETVSIRFDGVGDGTVIWAPRRENSIGVWKVKGAAVTGVPQLLAPSYVQREAVVSIYKAGAVAARVTAQSAVHAKGKGTVRLDIEALQKVSLRPSTFVWVDKDGDRHQAVNGTKITLKPKTSKSITVGYQGVEPGSLTWSPRAGLVAGAWGIG
jgi:hypothetical protein